jgi:4-hydroxy-2-oxoheptanedioate aldolase
VGINIRRSKVLEKLRNGEVATSFKLNLDSSRACELVASFDFDCIWLCAEHIANSYSLMEKQILAAKAYDTDVVVRVSRGSYSDYVKPLELDAAGVMVPHVLNADDARNIVKMTKFYPQGMRAIDGGNSDGKFCRVDFQDYLKQANEERFVIVQIEDYEALDNLEDICKVDGIDMIYFGPGDFSQSLGVPGKFDDPRINEARKYIAKTAKKYNKYAGTVGSTESYHELVDMGYRFINVGVDVVAMIKYCQDITEKISEKNISEKAETENINEY